ncbi:MAG: hypothetical protein QM753_19625 [Thermomicrobiales bacterium]
MIDPADALACARMLQDGAERVLDDLRLAERVAPYGELIRIGSAASGLMATQDIDLGLICSVLAERPVFDIAGQLFSHPCVRRVQVNDERPPYERTGRPEHVGIYCGIRYCEDADRAREWKIDLWFFPSDAPRPEIRMRERLLAAPDDERLAILQLKHALLADGRYGRDIFGIDVYRAVLDRGEQSLDEVIRGFMESD